MGLGMTAILAFLARPLIQVGVIVAGVLALWLGFATHYQSKGAQKQIIKTEKANAAVLSRADRVRAQSRSRGVRGVVDPNYLD